MKLESLDKIQIISGQLLAIKEMRSWVILGLRMITETQSNYPAKVKEPHTENCDIMWNYCPVEKDKGVKYVRNL